MFARFRFVFYLPLFEFAIFHALVSHAQPLSTPQQSMHTRQQNLQFKWLSKIVISASIKTLQHIFRTSARGKHQYGDELAILAQLLRYAETISTGQHHVEHDRVIWILRDELQRTLAISGDCDLVAFRLKIETQAV